RSVGQGGDRAGQGAGDVVDEEVAAVADDPSPGDHDVADVGRGGGEDDRLGEVAGGGAGQPDRVQVHGHQVGVRAGLDAARLGPAEGRVAVAGRGGQQLAGRPVAAPAGAEPFVELDRAGLLEQVDHRVLVGAER